MTDESCQLFPVLAGPKVILAMAGFACLFACAAPTKSYILGNVELELAADEHIVIYPPFRCLSETIADMIVPPSVVMSTADFQDAMYPWFEPANAPKDAVSLERLLGKPHVRARIDDLKVRYLVGVTTANEIDEFPGMFCGGGFGGAGCLGIGWEVSQTSLNAVIWDFRNVREPGHLSVDTSGTSLYIGVLVPIVFIANTEGEACQKIADVIVDGLTPLSQR